MEPNETNALEEAVQKGDLLESALKNIIEVHRIRRNAGMGGRVSFGANRAVKMG